ncbi:MAG TPA: SMI1/KNR4 family protein [Chloroflexota bacterium]|jgi:hypothetical protein
MAQYDWAELMREVNRSILAWPEIDQYEEPAVRAAGWLGYPGASESSLEAAEERLGAALPPSYREFLAFSNGWRTLTPFIYQLWPAADLEWYAVRRPELVEADALFSAQLPPVSDAEYFAYGPGQDSAAFRLDVVHAGLEVSDMGDGILLLSPRVVTEDGEWEALFVAPWLPGARRYRSFWDLVQAEHRRPGTA